jgi:hypothetical protein
MLIMPNDSPELTNFIFSQTAYDTRLSYKRRFFSNLTKDTVDNRVTEYPDFKCRYSYNTLTNADISATWPKIDDVEDMRDIMHKRGWTFFKVTGHMNEKQITGQGQIPFVYNHYKENLPWISLQVGNDKYTDYPGNIAIAETENSTIVFDKETFFTGFCRPWQGLPCIDSVRRDAAKRRLKFTTTTIAEKAIITVFTNTAKGQIAMMYDIDTDTDIINSIKFLKGKDVIGLINFDYMQDLPKETAQNLQPPKTDITAEKTQDQQNMWLTMLTK